MDSFKKKDKTTPTNKTKPNNMACANKGCFFCTMKEQDPNLRKAGLARCFTKIPITDDPDHVLVLSSLWNVAMTHPDDPEFPSLGVFRCMASLIEKGVTDRDWLLRNQNIYIPYYAAHVIGSYTMNKPEFAEIALQSGVVPPLVELLKGKLTWVEQRVAVRALGHLASYETTFVAREMAIHEEEVVSLAMNLASTCLDQVYAKFVGAKDENERLEYQSDLLTRGVGGEEMENRKAEEWASQLQCWSIYLLNCFAFKQRSLHLICKDRFLRELCGMWGGLVNHSSPAGVGLIRILCYTNVGRNSVAGCKDVVESLCNLSRSSDDWQYMAIDCLLLLLTHKDTRYKVVETTILYLADLVELKRLGGRSNLGESIAAALLLKYKSKTKPKGIISNKVERILREVWDMKVERRKRERLMSEKIIEDRRVLSRLIKRQGNDAFWGGDVERAVAKYSEALVLCPVKLRKERMVIYSNRAQCHLMLRDADAAISDATRALSLARPENSHGKSLWRRSQAYDMKGLAKESLMDCVRFVYECKRVKIPYHAARMISKQMDATWLFASARSKSRVGQVDYKLVNEGKGQRYNEMVRMIMEKKGLSTIIEEPVALNKEENGKKLRRGRRRAVVARSM